MRAAVASDALPPITKLLPFHVRAPLGAGALGHWIQSVLQAPGVCTSTLFFEVNDNGRYWHAFRGVTGPDLELALGRTSGDKRNWFSGQAGGKRQWNTRMHTATTPSKMHIHKYTDHWSVGQAGISALVPWDRRGQRSWFSGGIMKDERERIIQNGSICILRCVLGTHSKGALGGVRGLGCLWGTLEGLRGSGASKL